MILTVDRLTSDAAGMAYTVVLVAKILLAVYAFIVAWLQPRRRDRPSGGIAGAMTGPVGADHSRRTGNRLGRRAHLVIREGTGGII